MEKPETWKILTALAGCLVLFGFLAMEGGGFSIGNIVGGCLIGSGVAIAAASFNMRRKRKN